MGSENHPKLDASTPLKVEVNGDVIAVSLPGTAYRVLFRHRPNQPRLFQPSACVVPQVDAEWKASGLRSMSGIENGRDRGQEDQRKPPTRG
jgi:hypothetical protein